MNVIKICPQSIQQKPCRRLACMGLGLLLAALTSITTVSAQSEQSQATTAQQKRSCAETFTPPSPQISGHGHAA
jgi:hypothetical protein